MKTVKMVIWIFLFTILFSTNIFASTDIRALKQGDYIKMGIYNDEPIIWKVMGKNKNGTYVITDQVICFKAFSGMGTVDGQDQAIWARTVYDGATDRGLWGDPRWENSSLRIWLNSSDQQVDYAGVIKPSKENLRNTTVYPEDGGRYKIVTNAYDKEAGFLNGFQSVERDAIAAVTHKVLLNDIDKGEAIGGNSLESFSSIYDGIGKQYDRCYYTITTEKIFCPSIKELRDFFYVNNVSFHTTPTAQAYEADESKQNNKLRSDESVRYWLRTPELLGDSISRVYVAFPVKNIQLENNSITGSNPAESVNKKEASLYDQAVGVRPALYLKDGISFTGKGTRENPYSLVFKETTYSSNNSPTPSDWAKKEIEMAIEEGLITTKLAEGDYREYITREEFCELVMKLYDSLGGVSIPSSNNPFADTNNKEVIRAYHAGIINGMTPTTFSPSDTLTREQLCVMIMKTIEAAGEQVEYEDFNFQQNYEDMDNISSWAYQSVKTLNSIGVLNGNNNKLMPKDKVSKEIAIILLLRTALKL